MSRCIMLCYAECHVTDVHTVLCRVVLVCVSLRPRIPDANYVVKINNNKQEFSSKYRHVASVPLQRSKDRILSSIIKLTSEAIAFRFITAVMHTFKSVLILCLKG